MAEKLGLASTKRGRVAVSWAFVTSFLLLAAVALLNYYANAATWAIRWNLLQLIQFLGLTQLNSLVYEPIGMIGGLGEIAKWFGILLALVTVSLFLLRARLGARRAVLDSILGLLTILLVYEVGLALLCWNCDYDCVTALQVGTPMRWFTNMDLLLFSGLAVLGLLLSRAAPLRRAPAGRKEI